MPADTHHPAPPLTTTRLPTTRLNATRARQGRFGQHIFWMLVISTVLAALALFGAWGFRSNDLAAVEVHNGAKTPAEASRYSTEQSPARQTPGN